jgi:cephalosporin hydroxylase
MIPTIEPQIDTRWTMDEFRLTSATFLKHPDDLARYERIIAETSPDVIVETGTWHGESARWFADQGPDVITIDVHPHVFAGKIRAVTGGSTSDDVLGQVAALTTGRRTMVVLDSAHTAAHVAAEITAYGPLVSPGCYLVVEDGIFRFATPAQWQRFGFGRPELGNPLDAIEAVLSGLGGWYRDVEIERMSPISHHPGGWWVRT